MELSEGDRVGVRPPPDAGGFFKLRGDRMDCNGLALNPLIVRPLIGRLPPHRVLWYFSARPKSPFKIPILNPNSLSLRIS